MRKLTAKLKSYANHQFSAKKAAALANENNKAHSISSFDEILPLIETLATQGKYYFV